MLSNALERLLPGESLPVPLGKCGVIFTELRPQHVLQGDLFSPERNPKRAAFLATQDRINRRVGRHCLHCARVNPDADWQMRRDKLSPAYTTRWNALPTVKA